MSSLALHVEPLAQSVTLTDVELVVSLVDGRVLSTPLVWFPRLLSASTSARTHYEILGNGEGIHWPEVDEDISVAGLLAGNPSVEYHV
jgi:hypothetical protein